MRTTLWAGRMSRRRALVGMISTIMVPTLPPTPRAAGCACARLTSVGGVGAGFSLTGVVLAMVPSRLTQLQSRPFGSSWRSSPPATAYGTLQRSLTPECPCRLAFPLVAGAQRVGDTIRARAVGHSGQAPPNRLVFTCSGINGSSTSQNSSDPRKAPVVGLALVAWPPRLGRGGATISAWWGNPSFVWLICALVTPKSE